MSMLGSAVALVMAVGLALGVAPGAGAQDGVANSISLQVFNCPAGVTADTLVADNCALATDGFDVRIFSLEGVAQPLTLADASLDSGTFVFGDEDLDPGGLFGLLGIEETVLPAGYTSYVVTGGGAAFDESGYSFENTLDAPDTFLTIFNFAPGSDESDQNGDTDVAVTGGDETGQTVVVVDIDEDGMGTITFDLDGDGTIDFSITVGGERGFDR